MLVGRERERGLIDSVLERACAGETAALALVGEPGVGKTALLRYAVERAGDSLTVVRATGIETEAELEYSGLLQVCRPLVSHSDALPGRQAASLRVALGLETGAVPDRFEVGAATLALLAAAAELKPLLVVVDDAQWLDGVSAAALLFAARRLLADSVAFVLASRPEGIDLRGIETVEVAGLDESEAAELVHSAFGSDVSPEVVAMLHRATGGNPLALGELPRRLSPEQLSGDAVLEGPLPVGVEIERAFASRLDGVSHSTRRALCVLAATGSDDLALATRALELLGLSVDDLRAAEDAELITLDQASFQFVHPLLRSVAYQAQLPSERRDAHRALADALEHENESVVEQRAWHLAAAAVGPDERAAEALANAAAAVLSRGGYAGASKMLERSARLQTSAEGRLDRLVEAANAGWSGGDTLRARDLVSEVLAASPPESVRTQALQLAARIELLEGRMPRARALYCESAALAGPDDPSSKIRALGFVVYACMNEGRIAEAVEAGRSALELACSSGDAALVLQSEYLLGRSLLLAGETDEGSRLLFDVVDRIEAGDPGRLEVTRVAVALMVLGQPERAVDRALQSVELARQEGPMVLVQALAVQTAIAVRAGEWRTAVAACAEGLELARQLGQENPASSVLNDLAFVQAVRGEEACCRDTAALALAGFERSGAAAERERVRCTLGLLELGLDRLPEALAHFEEASGAVDAMALCDRDVSPEPDLVEALVRAGRAEEAPPYLERWLGRGAATTFWGPPLAARCRGLLGDGDSFQGAFEDALAAHEVLRDPFQLARTQLAYGQRLRREGRRVDSREQLRRALEGFERLEAEPWAERARQELRASGAKLRRAAESGDELTPQELQIALQVAEGKANKEVAAAMFLSTKTVEFHLSRIYRKLGLTSRSELVRRYATDLTVAAS